MSVTEKLSSLTQDSSYALEIGKAGEHLVCADLIMQGYKAFLSDQGLPFDVVAYVDDRLVRIQVKSTCLPKNMNAKGRNPSLGYSFSVRSRGKRRKGTRLNSSHCDMVALVALDIKEIAYFPLAEVGQTMQLTALHAVRKSRTNSARSIDEFPFSSAYWRLSH